MSQTRKCNYIKKDKENNQFESMLFFFIKVIFDVEKIWHLSRQNHILSWVKNITQSCLIAGIRYLRTMILFINM